MASSPCSRIAARSLMALRSGSLAAPLATALLAPASLAAVLAGALGARAEPQGRIVLPDIVVTPLRQEGPASRSGTAVSVITREEIEKASARDIGDLLRTVPGVTVARNGGPGSSQFVRIRGGDSRHTLVLIDGVRINDPISTGRELDFANLVLANVERIEVLRGPQSALYGSEAMGGVINIITRRGGNMPPQSNLAVEAGRYGTKEMRGGVVGGTERIDYSLGFSGLHTAGFSSFGYRIKRLRFLAPWGFEPDAAERAGVGGRIGLNLLDGVRLESGGSYFLNRSQFDAAFLPFPDTPSQTEGRLWNGYSRAIVDTPGNQHRATATVYANELDRRVESVTFAGPAASPTTFDSLSRFVGTRTGAEYQGDLKLGGLGGVGTFTYGGKVEREMADTFSQALLPVLGVPRRDIAAEQVTRAAFALYQVTLAERLSLSLGGRVDDVLDVDTFRTWRATAAYHVADTGATARASAGTGGKAPSLFQLYSQFGTPGLDSERSFGADAGLDVPLLDGRAKASATIFYNRYKNLIDFGTSPICNPVTQAFGCFFNVARAQTSGVELAGQAVLVPGLLQVRTTYTFLHAIDENTGLKLARRPGKEARVGLEITPFAGLSLEPAIVLVGDRFSGTGQTLRLPSYARLDTYASLKLNDTFSLFARGENLANTRFEEVKNFGTTGRAFYGGVRATW